jgi:hypothetical protein
VALVHRNWVCTVTEAGKRDHLEGSTLVRHALDGPILESGGFCWWFLLMVHTKAYDMLHFTVSGRF